MAHPGNVPRALISTLVSAVNSGDANVVKNLADQLGSQRWTGLVAATADEQSYTSAVHLALRAEFGLLSQRLTISAGALEQRLKQRRLLLRTLLRAGGPSRRWCPVVDAVHYRLVQSLRILLKACSPSALRECLMEVDAYGQTVLHAASAAKAPGIARRVLQGGDPSTLATVGRHIGVDLPLTGQPLSVVVLNDRISEVDLLALLEAVHS